MPRVTVLTAVFNGESHLRQAIDSVLNQTLEDFEFLIVDDASTDRSREIVLSYDDPRLFLLENERNLGLAASLNRGLAAARGEFVARLDADDVSEPDRLERQVTFLDTYPEVALLGTWYTEIGGERPRQRRLPCDYTAIRWALLFYCPFVHSAVIWRRVPVSAQVGGYNESLRHSMDFELWTRIARSFPVANLGRHLVRLRLHPGSMTMTYGDHTLEGHRLRVATVARLLRWPERGMGPGEFEERFLALNAVAHGTGKGVTPAHAIVALDDVLLLQEAFFEEAGISASERHGLSIALRRKVARNLARLARRGWSKPESIKTSLHLLATASSVWMRSVLPIALRPRVRPYATTRCTSCPV